MVFLGEREGVRGGKERERVNNQSSYLLDKNVDLMLTEHNIKSQLFREVILMCNTFYSSEMHIMTK